MRQPTTAATRTQVPRRRKIQGGRDGREMTSTSKGATRRDSRGSESRRTDVVAEGGLARVVRTMREAASEACIARRGNNGRRRYA